MQFLKILFFCLLAFVAALFTYGNWAPVAIQLWSGMEAQVKLPFLLLVAFLLGFLPTLIYFQAVRWRLRQRLNMCERTLADLRMPKVDPVLVSTPADVAIPPASVPTAVPPGVA